MLLLLFMIIGFIIGVALMCVMQASGSYTLVEEVERLESENDELRKEQDRFQDRLQVSPSGDDKIDELEQAMEFCKFRVETLEKQNEAIKEALKLAHSTLSAIARDEWPGMTAVVDAVVAIEKQIGGGPENA